MTGAQTYRPGVHSRNAARVGAGKTHPRVPFRRTRIFLIALGWGCLGYYAYSLADTYVYQAYENRIFDQRIAAPASSAAPMQLREGDLLGRLAIPRLGIWSIVREGVSTGTLQTAVGHIPSTSLPGHPGNFAIAAHRDRLFRVLKDIEMGDLVTFQSQSGAYSYRVEATKVVKPSDVSVLRADGGDLIQPDTPVSMLTMITCFPFVYIGSAPQRFIVEARLVSQSGNLAEK